MSLRRVPPPPPPGFGDEEYYRLYGRPEDYHRYREDLEHQHQGREERPRGRSSSLEPGEAPDDYPEPYGEPHNRYQSPPVGPDPDSPEFSSLEEAELTPPNKGKRRKFENFRVTIDNVESEGTPSLSELDEEEEEEREFSPVEKSRRSIPAPVNVGRKSAKERLGKRIPIRAPSPEPDEELDEEISDTDSSSEEEEEEEEVVVRKRPSPPSRSRRGMRSEQNSSSPGKKSTRDRRNGSRRKPEPSRAGLIPRQRGKSDRRRSRSPRNRTRSTSRGKDNDKRESERTGSRLRSRDNRRKKPRSGRRQSDRKAPLQKRIQTTNRENEEMLRRLARKRGDRKTSESNKVQSLAKLAGIELPESAIPGSPRRKTNETRKNRRGPSGGRSRRNRSPAASSEERRKRFGNVPKSSMRSDAIAAQVESRSSTKPKQPNHSSPGRWRHDKFTAASPINDERDEDFGRHWSQIRSERSKERDRHGSTSDSRSRRRRRRRRRRSSSSSSSSSSSRSFRSDRKRRRSYSSDSRSSRSSSYSSRSSSHSSESLSSRGSSIIRSQRRNRRQKNKQEQQKQQTALTASTSTSKPKETAPTSQLPKEQINVETSGKLLEDTNVVNGVVVKYSEPKEARKPKTKWRLYVFKGDEELPILYIHRQSAYLLGRDRKVADIPLDHPSCSKQHAVLQYRMAEVVRSDGTKGIRVAPYIIDLNSANGTFVNNQKIESRRYVQVLEKDVLKFGFSSREYVLLHDQSKESEEADMGIE